MAIRSFRDLGVWQKAVDLAVHCYHITKAFPREEVYGLTSQIRRAGVSVPANIAEGHARKHAKEYLRHLGIASGSLAELDTHVVIAARLEMIDRAAAEDFFSRSGEIGRMLNGLEASMQKRVHARAQSRRGSRSP